MDSSEQLLLGNVDGLDPAADRLFEREQIDEIRHKYLFTLAKKQTERGTDSVDQVTLEKDDETRTATIWLDNVEFKNALTGKMIAQLTDLLDELYEWASKGRVVLIRGREKSFCSGFDLAAARASGNHSYGLHLAKVMQYNLMRLQNLPMLSIAFIEGYALGGGAELALGADIRLVTSCSRVGFIHSRVGVCAGWGGGTRLIELVGPARAMDLLASGRVCDQNECLRIGLAEQFVSDQIELDKFVRNHTVDSSRTLSAIKSMVNGARSMTFHESLRHERHLFAATWGRAAHFKALDKQLKHRQ